MDKCKNIRKLLFEYNRSELNPESHKKVQVHLEGCPDCSAYFQETASFLKETVPVGGLAHLRPDVMSGVRMCLSPSIELAEDFWPNYDTKLFERLKNVRRKVFFHVYLPKLRPVITETLTGLLVLFVLFALIEKGLGYDLKTYIYLLKQVW